MKWKDRQTVEKNDRGKSNGLIEDIANRMEQASACKRREIKNW